MRTVGSGTDRTAALVSRADGVRSMHRKVRAVRSSAQEVPTPTPADARVRPTAVVPPHPDAIARHS